MSESGDRVEKSTRKVRAPQGRMVASGNRSIIWARESATEKKTLDFIREECEVCIISLTLGTQ